MTPTLSFCRNATVAIPAEKKRLDTGLEVTAKPPNQNLGFDLLDGV